MIGKKNLLQKCRQFIEKYSYNDLLKVVKDGNKSLYINFSDLNKFDREVAEDLLQDPKEIIEYFEEAIKEIDLPGHKEEDLNVRILHLPKSQTVKIRDFRSSHLGKLIAAEGLIRQASDIRPNVIMATFECPGCGAKDIHIMQKIAKLVEPAKCPSCHRKKGFRLAEKKLLDMQQLIIEEAPESLEGGEQPKRIKCILSGDLLDPKFEKRNYPGNKVRIAGVVREIPIPLRTGGVSTKYEIMLDANSIEIMEEEFEEFDLTPEDEKIIKELASRPDIYDKLINSVAPIIIGYDNIKQAIILQLFGGIKKDLGEGMMMRGDMHVFIVGDPGAAKSVMLRYVAALAPKARYISGKGATAAGLTASVVKDEFAQGWALEAGALVLANKGIACIDEIDKMSPEDRSAMHEALEQQTVTISKANIQATLRAETAVLAAANPKFGRFDPYAPIPNQIDLPPTLLNRFDLIFTVRDIPNPKVDDIIATHVLKMHGAGEVKKTELDATLIRKYIAYAKQHCIPKMTEAAQDVIRKFYVDLRSTAALEGGDVKAIPISARQLQALVRMAEASARVRLSSRVLKQDAQRAIELLKSSMMEVGVDPETGKFDIDRMTSGITATQRGRISIIKRIISDLESQFGKSIPVSEVVKSAEEEGLERDRIEEVLDSLRKKGDVFEPKAGLIQKVG